MRKQASYAGSVSPQKAPWLRFTPSPKTTARVEIRETKSENGFLPLAVPETDPNFVYAIFTDYAFAFEVTSVLILVALVGAVVLARRGE